MKKLNPANVASIIIIFCVATAIASPAQNTFATLADFDSTNGANPEFPMSLVQGTDGNFYGTTELGGAIGSYGTVFKLSPSLTTLYSFCAQTDCTDGDYPLGGLVQGTDGNFYGTTQQGGANGAYGTVFQITTGGTLTTLYSFCAQTDCTDGSYPMAGLVQGTDGNFYGTTQQGGANDAGTVFKVTSTGALTTIYSFCAQTDCTDGDAPYAGLVQGGDGNFYGTTQGGGANDSGTVFKITSTGALTTLYSFCAQALCSDGSSPLAGLAQGANGDFYGTTQGGGANGSYGTVFQITKAGALTTLYSFCAQSGCTDGESPLATLTQATDGNFYGTTSEGGGSKACINGCGTLFKITATGQLTTLHSFAVTDGSDPSGGLMQATNGLLYGTTYGGGTDPLYGTVFSLSAGLGAFVETRPTSGLVGATVTILGTNLTGTTSVSFNGTAAKFTVVSRSEITTTVPKGATSGKIEVTTPKKMLNSNAIFRVNP
ncbi:MAG: choice-of-anchor tandem repeat GloVer-containing protein [Candidatus Sulfotelmatobacter sp.]